MTATPPRLSVGVPVYNGERTLATALDALTKQTFTDFELIISDNASTDATADICAEYARRDSRIVVHRSPRNLGPAANFAFVLTEARGEYFVWAAADDVWEPEFAAANIAQLDSNPRMVASMCRIETPGFEPGTFPLLGSPDENAVRYLERPGLNGRFYGVFRRSALLTTLPFETFVGSDWWIILQVLKHGGFGEVDRVLFRKGRGGLSENPAALFRLNNSRLGRVFPMGKLAWRVVRESSLPGHRKLFRPMLRHFLGGAHAAMAYHLGRLLRAVGVQDRRRVPV